MISLARIARQVEREGRRWRLSPLIQGNTVAVVEYIPQIVATSRPTSLVVPVRAPVVVLRLDGNASMDAWSQVLRRRHNRQNVDLMKLVRARKERLLAQEMIRLQDLRRELRRRWREKFIASKTMFVPGSMPLEPGIYRGG